MTATLSEAAWRELADEARRVGVVELLSQIQERLVRDRGGEEEQEEVTAP